MCCIRYSKKQVPRQLQTYKRFTRETPGEITGIGGWSRWDEPLDRDACEVEGRQADAAEVLLCL